MGLGLGPDVGPAVIGEPLGLPACTVGANEGV